ncbi:MULTISPECIES: RHS repeat-associated core domain-containing protein [unclassified Marinobacter]|jgi:RHS repeat-associated protein|uniref:RHS repeat-associated core domain-containing protein n=1 Tax=unclassified Marinobacter TaxID=83889 RepID=UPI0020106E31|nr:MULTISPECIES: RHS repeat-associated core domain-containing protein [unclassified Marinobacter]MCL1482096.1 RHS domain-containing protein [Marinobacter sp.]MCL1487839.1 RHS domain-containing protein [Marinobacter sp.]UQG56272.1 RHS domain-containing protein [Marinobacter sp. M4C]UQG65076.1 RHS domain-containing protein [Marinobacter sp. M2C]UQG69355.1 RHS domain-containing protein [Marinobacter sp. M1C]
MNQFIIKHLWALSLLLLTALPLKAAEVVTYYHNDHLGSPIASTDSSGAVVWQQTYDPWGLKLKTNTDARGYTGNWLDEETGLADHKARWYTSSIGRFTAIDPVKWHESNIHSFNRYAYASNSPYTYVDTNGRNAVTAFGGLLVESYNAVMGKGFDIGRIQGALADGYNGEGAGFASSLYQDAESFIPIGAIAGALVKSAKLAKVAATKGAGKGLGNPFKNKSAKEIDDMFTKKGFEKRGPDPAGGTGGYVNPKTGRSYHIDPKEWGKFPEPNHVDVNRAKSYKGSLDKKKLPFKE